MLVGDGTSLQVRSGHRLGGNCVQLSFVQVSGLTACAQRVWSLGETSHRGVEAVTLRVIRSASAQGLGTTGRSEPHVLHTHG